MPTNEELRQQYEAGEIDFNELSVQTFINEYGVDPNEMFEQLGSPASVQLPGVTQDRGILADLTQGPPPVPPPGMPGRMPIPFVGDEWRDPQQIEQRLVEGLTEKEMAQELTPRREATEKALEEVEQEKARSSLRDLTGEGFFTRLNEAIMPRAMGFGEDESVARTVWATSQMATAPLAGLAFQMDAATGSSFYEPVTGLTALASQELAKRTAQVTGEDFDRKQFVVKGETQAEWLLRLMMLPQLAIEEFAIQTGAVEAIQKAQKDSPPALALRAAGIPLPEFWYASSDPAERGYDVVDSNTGIQKYTYTVLDKLRKGRDFTDDNWDATGHLPQAQRYGLYAGGLVAAIVAPWESPFIKAARLGSKARQISKFYMAMEPSARVGKRVAAAIEGVMTLLPGRSVNVAKVMRRRVEAELTRGAHRYSDLPAELRDQMDVVSRALYEEALVDVFSKANPKHAVFGAKKLPAIVQPRKAKPPPPKKSAEQPQRDADDIDDLDMEPDVERKPVVDAEFEEVVEEVAEEVAEEAPKAANWREAEPGKGKATAEEIEAFVDERSRVDKRGGWAGGDKAKADKFIDDNFDAVMYEMQRARYRKPKPTALARPAPRKQRPPKAEPPPKTTPESEARSVYEDAMDAEWEPVSAREATEQFLLELESNPERAADMLAETAFESTYGKPTKMPNGAKRVVEDTDVQKYLKVYEEGVKRYMRTYGLGNDMVNIGSPSGAPGRALWVDVDRAKVIREKLGNATRDFDPENPNVFDKETGKFSEDASRSMREWVAQTTGQSMPDKGPMSIDDANEAIYMVKKHMAGRLAHVRYAMNTTSAGHRMIIQGLASNRGTKMINKFYSYLSRSINNYIDLGVEDMPPAAQAVLTNLANRLRLNGQDLLLRAKQVQKETGAQALESVLQVLDMGTGRYDLPSARVVEALLESRTGGSTIDAVKKASDEGTFSGMLASLLDEAITPEREAEALNRISESIHGAILDVLEGAYQGVSRKHLERDLQRMSAEWQQRAWLEFFRDGKFGQAFDEFGRVTNRKKRYGDELAAGVRYAIKRRLRVMKDEAVDELIEAGIAVEQKVVDAAKSILSGDTDTVTYHGMRVTKHDPDDMAEALRWLNQTGGWALQYLTDDAVDFQTLGKFARREDLSVPNEVKRALDTAAKAGGFDPAMLHRFMRDPLKGDLRPMARWMSWGMNAWKTMQLSGAMFLNTAYVTTNIIDAPLMIHRNLGAEGLYGMMRGSFENAGVVSRITLSLTSWTDILGDSKGRFRLGLFDQQRYPVPKPTRADEGYVRAPDGTIYTWDQLARYAHENGLESSRARAELSRDLIDDMRRRDSGSLVALAKGGLVAWQRGLQEISHTVEVMARVGVMVDSIKQGKALTESVADARTALLDYGRLTEHEQSWIRMVVPFWSFIKANQVSFLRAMIKNPERVRQQLQGIQATWDLAGITPEERANWSEAQTGRIALGTLTEDGAVWRTDGTLDTQHRAIGLFGPSLSTPQGLSMMYDIANIVTLGALGAALGAAAKPGAEPQGGMGSLEDLARNRTPVIDLVFNAFRYLNDTDFRTGRIDKNLIVSPVLMRNRVFGEFIKTHFPVKKQYYDEDNEKFLPVEQFIMPEHEPRNLPVVYTVEGALAQAAYVSFIDMFGSELARPRDFFEWLGNFDDQMQYTRLNALEPNRTGVQLFQYAPGIRREKVKTAERVRLELREARLRDLEGQIPPRSEIPD